MEQRDLIEIRPDVMLGKPVLKGTRIPVELIVRKLGEGETIEDLLEGYPQLTFLFVAKPLNSLQT